MFATWRGREYGASSGAHPLLLPFARALVANSLLANAPAEVHRRGYLRFGLLDQGSADPA